MFGLDFRRLLVVVVLRVSLLRLIHALFVRGFELVVLVGATAERSTKTRGVYCFGFSCTCSHAFVTCALQSSVVLHAIVRVLPSSLA